MEAVQRSCLLNLKQIKQWIVKSKNSKRSNLNIQGASATESKYSDNVDPVAVEVEPTFPVLKKNFLPSCVKVRPALQKCAKVRLRVVFATLRA